MDASTTEPRPEALLFEYLEQRENDPRGALERLCRAHPAQAEALRARVRMLLGAGLIPSGPGQAQPVSGLPERLGEFRLVRRIGAGGMGLVVLARQESLDREVALKLVRPGQLLFEDARQRFQREVLTIARLNHPGIVPVYAVGEEGGIPFFAMEHVRGATLADVLRHLAGRRPAEFAGADLDRALAQLTADGSQQSLAPHFRGGWPETCLRIVREVAEALEHAHRLGVIHRDIKPSNVMVTRGGRVLLLDFGLSSEVGADRLTRSGSHVGSLPYMSPEMLAGEGRADRRSDVYSLGVTLYELLTLRLPYEGKTHAALTARVLQGEPAPIRGLNPAVSWEAETVCRSAMERDPERRYASASDLARDITNVLERRPITARRASPLLRARRLVERHPAWSVGAALGSLAFVVAPLLFAWQQMLAAERLAIKSGEVQAANLALERSLGEVVAERERAELNFERSLRAVEQMLQRVGDESLRDIPRMAGMRRDLLEEALSFHEQFLAERPDDPRQRRLVARALQQTASIHSLLARYDEARELFDEQRALLEGLLAVGDDPALVVELGHCLLDSAKVRKFQDDLEAAIALARRAVEVLEPLASRQSDLEDLQGLLGLARLELGDLLGRAGDEAGAMEELGAAIAGLRDALARMPSSELRRSLALGLHSSGTSGWRVLMDQPPAADELGPSSAALEEAAELRRELAEESGWSPAASFALTETLTALSNVRWWQGRHDERAHLLQEDIDVSARLASAFPDVPKFLDGQASSVFNLGNCELERGRLEESRARFELAGKLFAELRRIQPEQPINGEKLAYARYQEAFVLERLGDPAAAGRLALDGLSVIQGLQGRRNSARDEIEDHLKELVARRAAGLGRTAEAAAAARAFASSRDRSHEFFGGLCLLLAAEAAGAAADPRAEEYAIEGFDHLLHALEAGLTEEEAVRDLADEAMDPLRGLVDLRRLLAQHGLEGALEAPAVHHRDR